MFDNDNDVDRPSASALLDQLCSNPRLCGLTTQQMRVNSPWLMRIKHREQGTWIVAKRRGYDNAVRALHAKVERAERGPRGKRKGLSYWIPFPLQWWRARG